MGHAKHLNISNFFPVENKNCLHGGALSLQEPNARQAPKHSEELGRIRALHASWRWLCLCHTHRPWNWELHLQSCQVHYGFATASLPWSFLCLQGAGFEALWQTCSGVSCLYHTCRPWK